MFLNQNAELTQNVKEDSNVLTKNVLRKLDVKQTMTVLQDHGATSENVDLSQNAEPTANANKVLNASMKNVSKSQNAELTLIVHMASDVKTNTVLNTFLHAKLTSDVHLDKSVLEMFV